MSEQLKPKRVQRKRTKGWTTPAGAIYVGRPTRWGNPFRVEKGQTAYGAVARYREWVAARDSDLARSGRRYDDGPYSVDIRRALEGKDLMCWCPLGQPCHADVLLEIANRRAKESGE